MNNRPSRSVRFLRASILECMVASASLPVLGQPTDTQAARFYEDALLRYEKQDLAGAIIQLKNTLQIDRNMLPVHVLLGKALLASSELVAAEVAFDEALRLGVNRAEVVLPLTQAVMGQGRPQDVLNQPRFALEGLPQGIRFELQLARAAAASDLGDHRLAIRELVDARTSGPDRVETWLAEVPIRIRAAHFDEAMQAGNTAVALAPGSAQANYELGSIHHAQARVGPALKAHDKALSLQPDHQEALIARAGLYLDLGRFDAAKVDVDAVRKVSPKDPRAVYLAALVSEKLGDVTGEESSELAAFLFRPVHRPQLLEELSFDHGECEATARLRRTVVESA